MMGHTQFRRGNKYEQDLHGNAKAVGLGKLNCRSKFVNANASNDETYALAA